MSKTITGTFLNASGSPLAFGTLYLKLVQDATVAGTGQVAPATTLAFPLDINGSLGAGVTILASDELTPSGISYVLTVSEQGGGQVFGPEFFLISGASPINLNNLTPSANSPVVFSTAIFQNPTSPQTITGQSLTLTSSAPLLLAAGITSYNGNALITPGVPSILASIDLVGQAAAIGGTNLIASVPAPGGRYRISYVSKVTQAASVSSTLGGANGFQIVYTDADDSVLTTSPGWWSGNNNGAAPTSASSNTTITVISGMFVVNAKSPAPIQYMMGYTSAGGTPMQYNLHIRAESI